jgi:hypothetical protein
MAPGTRPRKCSAAFMVVRWRRLGFAVAIREHRLHIEALARTPPLAA